MRLELFDLIDKSSELLTLKKPSFKYIESKLISIFDEILNKDTVDTVGFSSRVKGEASLKEKIIRNKYYLDCEDANDVLKTLPDLIGVTIECRFITDEQIVFDKLVSNFTKSENYYVCNIDENCFLNFFVFQPQQQRNGFNIYRIDGYYMFNGEKVNFELQIKSLVHKFWSEIEHEVVYKNTHFILNDKFMKLVLTSVFNSLEVVDNQLQIVYDQMIFEGTQNKDFGMSEQGFKLFLAKSISDLYSQKMVDSLGFTTDFKNCSAILSQYIYITDFIRNDMPQVKMVEYFEHFNLLKMTEIDFTYPITFETSFSNTDPFIDLLGKYFTDIINVDYEWHVFFVMLFVIEPGSNSQDFAQFVSIIKNLLINPMWYDKKFETISHIDAQKLKDLLSTSLAKALIEVGKIEIVHEEKLYAVMNGFRDYVELLEKQITNINQVDLNEIQRNLRKNINMLF